MYQNGREIQKWDSYVIINWAYTALALSARLLERYQNWEDIDNVTDAKF